MRWNVFFVSFLILSIGIMSQASSTDPKASDVTPPTAEKSKNSSEAVTKENEKENHLAKLRRGSSFECLSDPIVIQELKAKNDELSEREKKLNEMDQEFKNREKVIDEQLKKLDLARKEIAGIKESKKKANEERVTKLVDTIEKMSPKAAATLLSSVETDLAVESMSRVSTTKLAKIMNSMDPKKSSELSELMTIGKKGGQ